MFIDIKEMFTMSKHKLVKQNEFLCAVIEHNKEVFVEVLKENEDLKLELMNYENGYLATENRMLKESYTELEEKYFNNLTDNEYLEKRVEELEIDLEEYHKMQDKQQEKFEDSMLYGEDNPYYIQKYNPKLYDEILKNQELEETINTKNLVILGLECDKEVMKDKIKTLENICLDRTQENLQMQDYISELEKDNLEAMNENLILKSEIGNIQLENQMYSEKIEELTDQLEIKERLDTDKPLDEDYYSTKELDYGLLSKTIDKITDERNTYKEVINIMCDKFDISHDSVLNIIDDISQNKSVEKERV